MDQKQEAEELFKKFLTAIAEESMDGHTILSYSAKQCALIHINEKIAYHESLFDKGFKDVHIAISSPVKTYVDILNPALEHLKKVKTEIENL